MTNQYLFPAEWCHSKLDDLFSHVIGGDWGKDSDFDDPDFIEARCIRGTEFKNWDKEKGLTAVRRKVKKSSIKTRKLMTGDILVEISGGGPDQPVGRTVLIDNRVISQHNGKDIVCTNFLRLARPVTNICPYYLNGFLRNFYLSGEIIKYQGGSNNLRNLKFKEYSTINIPLPPLAEQKEITTLLDNLLAQVDTLKTRLDAIPNILKRFRQSVLAAVVSGKLTEEWRTENTKHEWEYKTIGDVCAVATGKTPSRSESSYWDNGTVPWLTSAATGDAFTVYAKEYITALAVSECQLKKFEPGTLLLAMYGEGKTRGQVTELKLSATCNQACAAITVNESIINRKFVKIRLQENYEETRKAASGGNQPNLNLSKVREIPIPLPPIEEQTEIVRRVEELFAFADQIEQRVKVAQQRVNHLTQAILAKAFRGELTAAWREQNPELISGENSAAALLARIQAERKK